MALLTTVSSAHCLITFYHFFGLMMHRKNLKNGPKAEPGLAKVRMDAAQNRKPKKRNIKSNSPLGLS